MRFGNVFCSENVQRQNSSVTNMLLRQNDHAAQQGYHRRNAPQQFPQQMQYGQYQYPQMQQLQYQYSFQQDQIKQRQPVQQTQRQASQSQSALNINNMKPSELKAEELTITSGVNQLTFTEDITFKMNYSCKQIQFLFSDKAKLIRMELKFDDLEEIEVNTQESTISLETKQPFKQYKQVDNLQWAVVELICRDEQKPFKVTVKFPKEALTKPITNKYSHVEKFKQCHQHYAFKNFNVIGGYQDQKQTIVQPLLMSAQSTAPGSAPRKEDESLNRANSQYALKDNNEQQKIIASRQPTRMKERYVNQEDESNVSQSNIFRTNQEALSEKELEQLFPKISQEKLGEIVSNFEKSRISSPIIGVEPLSQEEKIKKLIDEFKIKLFKNVSFTGQQNLRCPYFKCGKTFGKAQSLRNHIKKNHPKLSEIELSVDDNGQFTWSDKALDYLLMLGQVYPQFLKSIVKDMKQRKEIAS